MSDKPYRNDPGSGNRDQIDEILAEIRARLDRAGEPPESATLLLQRVLGPGAGLTREDEEMLSLVLDDFEKGVDIRSRYPLFYERLLENPDLRDILIDILELFVDPGTEATETFSDRPPNLDFLGLKSPQAIIEIRAPGWQAVWRLTARTLTELFSPEPEALLRSGELLEDPWIVLIRNEIDVPTGSLLVNLEITQNIHQPDILIAMISVFNRDPDTGPPPPVEASLVWKDYHQTVTLSAAGPDRFPDVSLQDVYDPASGSFSEDLLLTLTGAGR